jgi:hypothetical protein
MAEYEEVFPSEEDIIAPTTKIVQNAARHEKRL